MKKLAMFLALATLLVMPLAGCGSTTKTLKIGATSSPHAEILESIKDEMAKRGITLEIVEYTDYVQPNVAVQNGELDANYFQHQSYLDDYNAENSTDLVSVADIHYEPMALFPGKTKTIDALKKGAKIAVPNDTTNEARALLLLEQAGLITLKKDAGLKATKLDIVENPKKIEVVELEAAQLVLSLQDVDMAVINGNYALQAGLSATTDGLAVEADDSLAAKNYVNVIVVKAGNENNEEIKVLCEVMKSEAVRTFINEKYKGAVVPVF